MAVAPLAADQQRAVDALVAARRLSSVPADAARASVFMRSAQTRLLDVPHVTQPQNAYALCYDACHDVGEALLAAYGLRTTNGAGQHEALAQFLRALFTTPPADAAAARVDALRLTRNKNHYAAKPITAADAQVAFATAAQLLEAAAKQGLAPN